MKILKFTLSGETAFFKKPDVNKYFYFTYGNIHKVALLGILGAILGYEGYNQQGSRRYPQFYERLKDIRLSITPMNNNGYIPKKVQEFNNSVGYASLEASGNLIIREQWLERPSWNIYVDTDHVDGNKLVEFVTDNKAVYIPYLGKNDHLATISNAYIVEGKKIEASANVVNSFIPKLNVCSIMPFEGTDSKDSYFKYQEMLPIALDEQTNMYKCELFIYTNMKVVLSKEACIYKIENDNIVFY